MLGSIADAEDVVHDTFLKWMTIDASKIQNTKAFLVKSVTNNCINLLKRSKRMFSDDLTEEMVIETQDVLHHGVDLEQRLQQAWSLVSFKLAPVERAIYVLREVFNLEYEDLQHIVDKNADNCRKLFSRAKHKLAAEVPKINVEVPTLTLPSNFKRACSIGCLSEFITDLKLDFQVRAKKK